MVNDNFYNPHSIQRCCFFAYQAISNFNDNIQQLQIFFLLLKTEEILAFETFWNWYWICPLVLTRDKTKFCMLTVSYIINPAIREICRLFSRRVILVAFSQCRLIFGVYIMYIVYLNSQFSVNKTFGRLCLEFHLRFLMKIFPFFNIDA